MFVFRVSECCCIVLFCLFFWTFWSGSGRLGPMWEVLKKIKKLITLLRVKVEVSHRSTSKLTSRRLLLWLQLDLAGVVNRCYKKCCRTNILFFSLNFCSSQNINPAVAVCVFLQSNFEIALTFLSAEECLLHIPKTLNITIHTDMLINIFYCMWCNLWHKIKSLLFSRPDVARCWGW